MDEYKTQRLAEAVIRENPSRRILDFAMDGEKYWIKRKLGNGRNQLVKYSVEKEFYYEIARITIAGKSTRNWYRKSYCWNRPTWSPWTGDLP